MPVVQASYQFASKRRPVKTRPKFRPVPDLLEPGAHKHQIDDSVFAVNIHHDPRVARGNTFAVATSDNGPSRSAVKTSGGIRHTHSRSSKSTTSFLGGTTVFSEPSLRDEINLTKFLVEPGEGEVRPEHDMETQTDEFEARPQTPDFVPKKTGVDVSTQIEPSDNLFNFDLELQPLLAVLVGKTLEQARIEVEREHELECIRQEALVLNRQREDEARRVATLKEAAVTAEREKEELRKRRREEATARRLVKEKVACVQLMRQLLPLSLGAAIADLTKRSWQTPTVHQIKTIFLPSVFSRVAAGTERNMAVRAVLHSLHTATEESAEAARNRRTEARRQALESRHKARFAALQRVIRLFIPPEVVGRAEDTERLGPIEACAANTVEEAEAMVVEWLAKNRGGGGEEEEDEVPVPERGFLAGYLQKAVDLSRRDGRTSISSDSVSNNGIGSNSRGHALGVKSTLLEIQERSGAVSDEILLESIQ